MEEEGFSEASVTSTKRREGSSDAEVRGQGSLALINEILENAMQDAPPDKDKELVDDGAEEEDDRETDEMEEEADEDEDEEEEEEEEEEEVEEEEKEKREERQEGAGGGGQATPAATASDKAEATGEKVKEEGEEEEDDDEEEDQDSMEQDGEGREEKSGSPGTLATTAGGSAADKGYEASARPSTPEEFVEVDLSDIRKDVQCPICLGIICKTRTVMECLHRFCRECIDKSMRLGNNECPVCRTHCASRRSLRDDLNFDALIAALYPNVDSYEEEEFALREENERRNKQLQQSIAETLERQSDAITRRCTTSKVPSANAAKKTQTRNRNAESQNKGKTSQSMRGEDEDYVEEYEQTVVTEIATRDRRTRRRKREAQTSQPEATDDEQVDVQANKSLRPNTVKTSDEAKGETSGSNAGRLEGIATWARAGSRSAARYGNVNNSNNRLLARATMLLEALSTATQLERDIEFDVHLILQPFTGDDYYEKLPSLDKPYICCPANVTVQHVCEFLVNRLPIDPDEELELILGSNEAQDLYTDIKPNSAKQKGAYESNDGFRIPEILHPQATLGQIHEILWHCHGNLVLLYRRRI